MLVDVKNMK